MKKDIEHRHAKLMREHEHIKVKLFKIQAELKEKSDYEEKFNQDIEELSQETQSLVEENRQMANINIKFNNKDYLLSCDDGQEESL